MRHTRASACLGESRAHGPILIAPRKTVMPEFTTLLPAMRLTNEALASRTNLQGLTRAVLRNASCLILRVFPRDGAEPYSADRLWFEFVPEDARAMERRCASVPRHRASISGERRLNPPTTRARSAAVRVMGHHRHRR